MLFKRLFIFFLLIGIFLSLTSFVQAEDFHSDYQVEYFLTKNQDTLNTQVNFNIKITNLRSDIYVNKFSISFPKNFIIHDLTASDDNGPITPTVTDTDDSSKIDLEFTKPQTGRDSVNNFNLKFTQDNLFNVNGNVWEVILPTIQNKGDSNYKVIVNLPPDNDKKISIAKPLPDSVAILPTGRQIIWNNPATKTIYAIFGDEQFYKADLVYNILNPKFTPVYTDIAFPPDTLYQKTFWENISPKPDKVWRDDDGNLLGRYYLNPQETKTVNFSLYIETFNQARPEVQSFENSLIPNQQKYLLSPQQYWQLSDNNLTKIASLNSASDVYYFVTNDLKYDYNRLPTANDRMGADAVLSKPDQAVCVEFTDLFVAAAREKGILSREVEGYGFTQDTKLRPLSLSSDILHSWPEYYDPVSKKWIEVDPTWENTSGIDYFNSFDLNHIVFAVHGKRDDYPLPAGMYKLENSHDIMIVPTLIIPDEKLKITLADFEIPKSINNNQNYQSKLKIVNESNMYVWNVPVEMASQGINLSIVKTVIPVLAPMEQTEIPFTYSANAKNTKTDGELNVKINNFYAYSSSFTIVPYYYDLSVKIGMIVFGLAIIVIGGRIIKFRKKR